MEYRLPELINFFLALFGINISGFPPLVQISFSIIIMIIYIGFTGLGFWKSYKYTKNNYHRAVYIIIAILIISLPAGSIVYLKWFPPTAVTSSQLDTRRKSLVRVEYSENAPNHYTSPTTTAISITYYLKNIGEIPAIVTDVTAHMYLSESEPDPGAQNAEALIEDARRGGNDPKIALNEANSVTLAPGQVFSVDDVFGFRQNKINALTFDGQLPLRYTNFIWLLVVVKYHDVYSNDRATSLWVHIAGAGAIATKLDKYNYEK